MEITEGKQNAFLKTMGTIHLHYQSKIRDFCHINGQLRNSQVSKLRVKIAIFSSVHFAFSTGLFMGFFRAILEYSEAGGKLNGMK